MISEMATAAILTVGLAGQSFAAECIAPANPGGGWDFTCRSITKIMNDIGAVAGAIKDTNMAGGGGDLAYTHRVTERHEDTDLSVDPSTRYRRHH